MPADRIRLGVTATFVVAALAASGTAAASPNHGCSNGGYFQNWRTANNLFDAAVSRMNTGRLLAATSYIQRARNRVHSAPVPCNSGLLTARTYTLKEYADTLQALRASDDGDFSSAQIYLQRALDEQDIVARLVRRWEAEHPPT